MSTIRYDFSPEDPRQPMITPTLLYVSTARNEGDWHSVPHSHSCAEIFFVLRGKGRFQVEGESITVSSGDLIFVNPLVHHTETDLDTTPLEYLVLGLNGIELPAQSDESGNYRVVTGNLLSEDLQYCLHSIAREAEAQEPGFQEVCQDLAEILAIRLMRRPEFSNAICPSVQNVSKESVLVRRYIDSHFKENLSLDQLAEVAHINKYHMSHLFSREYGISPISYLLSLRLQESKRLLRTTDYTLTQIAQFTGFSSLSYFSQSFRRATGVSPAHYRLQSKKNTPATEILKEETP